MKREFFYVHNVTDGMLAHPEPLTQQHALAFIKAFPERYAGQGYYKTANGIIMDPKNVILIAIEMKQYQKLHGQEFTTSTLDDFSDLRNRDDDGDFWEEEHDR